jgi:2-dehydropantoate 2-reductase
LNLGNLKGWLGLHFGARINRNNINDLSSRGSCRRAHCSAIARLRRVISTHMRGPGHAFHNGMNVIRIGPFWTMPIGEIEAVASIWRAAGFKTEAVSDVVAMQWEKLICNVAYSAPCALTGMTVGEMMDDPDMGPVSRTAAVEAWTVARALGIPIKVEDPLDYVRKFAAGMPGGRPSLLQDLEQHRRSEIDAINGAVPRAAAELGIEAPVNGTLVALVKQRERDF